VTGRVGSLVDKQLLESIEDLERIRDAWTDLWSRSPRATTFQRPEWLLAWLHLFRPEVLRTVALWRGPRLVGLVPLFAEDGVLFPVGAGITDYLDGLFENDEPELVAAFWDVASSVRDWESLDFEQLRQASPLLGPPGGGGLVQEVIEENASPVLVAPADGDLREVLSNRHLKNLRYARRQLERAGNVEWIVAEEASLGDLLDALFRTHAARWEMKGQSGVLGEEIQALHREAAAGLLERGVLRLYGLKLDGRIAGALESFFESDCAYFYLHGFEPGVARYSPGLQLIGRFVDDAMARGIRTIDFLRGREDYKYRWGAADVPTYRLRVRRR
jgi:CelD/BcsL family acetyltransferase involved in cellulose biosynthesis